MDEVQRNPGFRGFGFPVLRCTSLGLLKFGNAPNLIDYYFINRLTWSVQLLRYS
jgi:hypothetical protein